MSTIDFDALIRELRERTKRISEVITTLEGLQAQSPPQPGKRRGRHGMGPDERSVVSLRMKAYWNRRRSESKAATSSVPADIPR